MRRWVTWRTAMEQALYGETGFYGRGERPEAHFRTSVHASARYAEALAGLLVAVDEALGHPPRLDLVDIGAGSADLLTRILDTVGPDLAERVDAVAVDLAPRPEGVPERIAWRTTPPDTVTGLVLANEWLDNVPLDVVELTAAGPRTILVDPATGAERPGPVPDDRDLAWLERWWPLREPGDRAEVGHPRCDAWAGVLRRLAGGLAVAMDYAHDRGSRPVYGTLTGYRAGRTVPAVPDGSCDITAHVALDACLDAGRAAGATASALTTQRRALRALGLTAARPPIELARTDPRGYVAALSRAGEEAELIDPSALGGFGWLAQSVGVAIPQALTG
ncbi:MAG TPA: SAM-dependent methyltransferase [Thermomonospora sp.]|nr:SAM-dependent methyltransferase [Thermomonospora sp.]